MHIQIADPSSVSRAGDSASVPSAPDSCSREPGLAVPKAGSVGFAASALAVFGTTMIRPFWKRRNPAGERWAGVANEHALKGRSRGSPSVR
jgi:hypothetical protein